MMLAQGFVLAALSGVAGTSQQNIDVVVNAVELSSPNTSSRSVEATCGGVRYRVSVSRNAHRSTTSVHVGRKSAANITGPLGRALSKAGPAEVEWLCYPGGAALTARILHRDASGPPAVTAVRAYFRRTPTPVEVSVHEQALDTAF